MILETINSPADLKKLNIPQLETLAGEIREFLLETVPKTGGHLAPNLGVVELTLALHYVLDAPKDKIVWDVGHQSYVHKILTGRRDQMSTLRQFGGLSGFPKPSESEYDSFATGHSSTAISVALGMAQAKTDDSRVVAVVGDGSMTGGLSFEGLNNCGQADVPMMIVLNDNEMSISKNVGALSNHLANIRASRRYNLTKVVVKKHLAKIPLIGKYIVRFAEWLKNFAKSILVPNVLFEQLGIKYIGIVDGHNIKKLIRIFENAKDLDSPVLVHVKTVKGKGDPIIEQYPSEYHSVSENCDMESVYKKKFSEQDTPTSFSLAMGKKLCSIADENDNVVAITAAMTAGTGLTCFANKYPDRFYDVGIAEQHALASAAGMASAGKKPFVAIYSSFVQRAYDQLIHDVCIQSLPVVLCLDRAGLTGRDGETHNGQFDLAFLQHIPNLTVFAPSTISELNLTMDYAMTSNTPVAIRYGKNNPSEHELVCDSAQNWRSTEPHNSADPVIFATGATVTMALNAKKQLSERGISVTVVNMLCVKPLNYLTLDRFSSSKLWITVEDGCIIGGIGSSIAAYASQNGYSIKVKSLGVPDKFVPHGTTAQQYGICSMTVDDIVNVVTSSN
ncbi:MAG: 1-deoxy-D-xylulose-5-phosphate synthase [Clostridiales bacterium]|nr:1-deoxy-D-xylulose-5-phosphate synthase [Clostridiales bacterium]